MTNGVIYSNMIAPPNVFSFESPEFEFHKFHMKFLNQIDQTKVAIMLDAFEFDVNRTFEKSIKFVIISMFGESPRVHELVQLAQNNPELSFIWLTDINLYDFKIPTNIIYVRYKQWHYHLLAFKQHYPMDKLVLAKDKKIIHKFSSLSYKKRQSRALVTCLLKTFANDQSYVSWHHTDHPTDPNPMHQVLIDSIKSIDEFSDIDWSHIDNPILLKDHYAWDNNKVLLNTLDIDNPAFANSLINFSNETDSYGYYNDGTNEYIRPGPYLTEKTIKCLLSGTVLFSVGPPFVYEFLKNEYHLPMNYSFDMSFDNHAPDITRLINIASVIKELASTKLTDLIDANIDSCQEIQKIILDQSYIDLIDSENQSKDVEILNLLNC